LQAVKNGLKSALRTPGKTLLFVLILTVTAALLTVSCCVFGAVRSYLDDCGNYFHTIAELEYIGDDYPNQVIYDEKLVGALEENRDTISALIGTEPVLSWEPASAELMLSPMLHRRDLFVPDPNAAVLRIKLYAFQEDQGLYTAMVTETFYSRQDFTNRLIMVRGLDGAEPLDFPAVYLAAGQFFRANTPNPTFQIESVSFLDDGSLTQLPPLLPDGASVEDEAPFRRYAETLRIKNDACRVAYTGNIEDLYPFHQQLTALTEGRYFTQAEYDAKARVCIVSEKLAGMLSLAPGDTIPCTVFRADGDLYDAANHRRIDEGDYEIVGIAKHSDSYPFWVFLPDANVGSVIRPVNGYSLGQFRLKNDGVQAFLEAAAPLLAQNFQLNVYDQGFSAATEPMKELLLISGIFLAVCLLLAGCALALQSHLFISRQRESARIMCDLGSGRAHVCHYFLSSALALTLLGAALGALVGMLAEDKVFEILRQFAAQFAEQDLRFSSTKIAVTRTLDFAPASVPARYLTAAGIQAGGSLLFTLFFALGSLRQRKQAKKKPAVRQVRKHAGRVSRLSGFFKYSLLSLRRSKIRTAAVLLLGLTAALFFGRLTFSLAGYREQLDAYKANAVITGSATDYYGRWISGLLVNGHSAAKLGVSELVKDSCATTNLGHIKFLGVVGKEQLPFSWPNEGTFAYETVYYLLNKEPAWAGSSSVSRSPLFYYSQSGSVDWLEGWSEADFIRIDDAVYELYDDRSDSRFSSSYRSGPAVCAVPQNLMEAYGIELGDRINTVVAYYHPYWKELLLPMELQVVASYVAPVGSSTIFSPVTLVRPGQEDEDFFPVLGSKTEKFEVDRRFYSREELAAIQALGLSPAITYSSFTFTLRDSDRLDELRQVLEDSDFTWARSPDRTKSFVKLEDEVYLNTTHSMERQIQYVSVLYDALYLLAGIIGFALAWLLVQSRRREIAVMRAMGTQPGRIVGNFLLEQLLLMAIGLGIGVGVSRLTGAALNKSQLLLTAAFLGVWTLSALICLIVGLRKKSFAALTEPE
jgi:cell division protein FtsX